MNITVCNTVIMKRSYGRGLGRSPQVHRFGDAALDVQGVWGAESSKMQGVGEAAPRDAGVSGAALPGISRGSREQRAVASIIPSPAGL